MQGLTFEYLMVEYIDKQRSTYDIAEQFNTYPNKILRILKKFGIPIRSKAEAQSLAITTGRHPHPTKGRPRPEKIKLKIKEKLLKRENNGTRD